MKSPDEIYRSAQRMWEEPPAPSDDELRAEKLQEEIDRKADEYKKRPQWLAESIMDGPHTENLRDLLADLLKDPKYRARLDYIAWCCAQYDVMEMAKD